MARSWREPTRTKADALVALRPAPKIALLRGGGLGDFLSVTPALMSLRAALPDAQIVLLTNANLAAFAKRYRAIDRTVVAPSYRGVIDGPTDARAVARFFDAMRREAFDLALQWHGGGTNSNSFVRQLGARLTVGFRGEDAEPLDYWIPYDIRQHEILRYLDTLRLLGIQGSHLQMQLPVTRGDLRELAQLGGLVDLEMLNRGWCMGIHASAGGLSRRWPAERFALVADRLVEEFDFDAVLVTAGPGQEADSASVIDCMAARHRAIDLGGKTTVGALVALISRLRLLVSNDSGPAHMAVALDVPSVTVFGSAHPANWAPLQRTWHRAVAYWGAPCRWLVRDGCLDLPTVECLQGVHPEDVLVEARQLLTLADRLRPPMRCRQAGSSGAG